MGDMERTLRVGLSYAPGKLDDPNAMDASTVLATSPAFETPCELGEFDDVVRPVLFDGELRRTEPTTWEADLPPDLKLSNGEPLEAAELADHLAGAAALDGVRVSARGRTLVFRTPGPEDRFPRRLISRSTLVALRRGDEIVGTGPFRVTDRRRERVRLERNPHHRGAQARASEARRDPEAIEFIVLPRDAQGEATALVEALNDHTIDLTFDLTRDEVERVQRVRRTFRPGDSTCVLSLNTQGAFADPELRSAISMALDRHDLADLCYQNPVAYVARGVLPPQLARVGTPARLDREAARDIIARKGPGRPLRMLRVWASRPYLPRPAAVAKGVIDQLADVGLEIRDQPAADASDYHATLTRGDYDLVLGGWIADTGNPAEFMNSLLHSSMVPSPSQQAATACNMARVRDPELDRRIEAYAHDGSAANLEALQARVDELRPLLPLMYGPSIAVAAWRVMGLDWKDRRMPNLADVELNDLDG